MTRLSLVVAVSLLIPFPAFSNTRAGSSRDFQQQLRRAGREFTVTEGQTTTLDLRLAADL